MQPERSYSPVIWLFFVLMLSGCGSTPDKRAGLPDRMPDTEPARPVERSTPRPIPPHRQTVVATARDMLGRPYRYGGKDPRGFDCSGLVWYSHKRAGIRVPRTTRLQMNRVREVSTSRLRAGDLLFFRIRGRSGYHVGIYVGDGMFIHAPSSGKRVTTASLDNPYWRARLLLAGNYYY